MWDCALEVKFFDGRLDCLFECVVIFEGLVCEMMSFEIAPGVLDIVQLGSITGQPFDSDPVTGLERSRAELAGMDRPVVEDQDDRLGVAIRARRVPLVDDLQQIDEVGAPLGPRGVDDEFPPGPVECPHQSHFLRLTRGRYAQIRTALGPSLGKVGMRQRLRLVRVKQYDVAGLSLLLAQLQPQSDPINRLGILPADQRVARTAPSEPPFFRSRMLSRDFEMLIPARRSISACSRGSVQFTRFSTGSARIPCATASARSPLLGSGPGAMVERNASTPPVENQWRQCRTEHAVTPKASPTSALVQPANVNKIARARSASPRTSERAKSFNEDTSSGLTDNWDRPDMTTIHRYSHLAQHYIMCPTQGNPA